MAGRPSRPVNARGLEAAGIERPGAIVVAAMNPEELTGDGNYGSLIGTYLGLSHVPVVRVEKISSQVSVEALPIYTRLVRGVVLSIRALASLDAPPRNVVCYAYLGRQSTGLARNREMGQ